MRKISIKKLNGDTKKKKPNKDIAIPTFIVNGSN